MKRLLVALFALFCLPCSGQISMNGGIAGLAFERYLPQQYNTSFLPAAGFAIPFEFDGSQTLKSIGSLAADLNYISANISPPGRKFDYSGLMSDGDRRFDNFVAIVDSGPFIQSAYSQTEFWFRIDGISSFTGTIPIVELPIIQYRSDDGLSYLFYAMVFFDLDSSDTSSATVKIRSYYKNGALTGSTYSDAITANVGEWLHVSIVRLPYAPGGGMAFWINGIRLGGGYGSYDSLGTLNFVDNLFIGHFGLPAGFPQIAYSIDDFLYVQDIIRSPSGFTPPNSPVTRTTSGRIAIRR